MGLQAPIGCLVFGIVVLFQRLVQLMYLVWLSCVCYRMDLYGTNIWKEGVMVRVWDRDKIKYRKEVWFHEVDGTRHSRLFGPAFSYYIIMKYSIRR